MKNEAVVARNDLRTAREKWVGLPKGNEGEPCGHDSRCPDSTSVRIPDMILFHNSRDGAIGGNLVKGTEDLLVLFPTKACESTIIPKINE